MTKSWDAEAQTGTTVSLTDDEVAALKELHALLHSNEGPMPRGIPMSPQTVSGRKLLKRLDDLLGDGLDKPGRL